MTTICVQFADSTEKIIIAAFGGPQNATTYPNQGTVESTDARWTAFYDSFSPQMQTVLTVPGS